MTSSFSGLGSLSVSHVVADLGRYMDGAYYISKLTERSRFIRRRGPQEQDAFGPVACPQKHHPPLVPSRLPQQGEKPHRERQQTKPPNPSQGARAKPHLRRRRWSRWRRSWRTSRASPGARTSWRSSTASSSRPTATPCASTPPASCPSSPTSTPAPTPSASSTSCTRPRPPHQNPNPLRVHRAATLQSLLRVDRSLAHLIVRLLSAGILSCRRPLI